MPNIYEEKQESSLSALSHKANVSRYCKNLLTTQDSLDKAETECILFSSLALSQIEELKLAIKTLSDREYEQRSQDIQELCKGLQDIYKDVKSIRVSRHATPITYPKTKYVYPMEIGEILTGQCMLKKLNEKQTAEMIKLTCQKPNVCANK